MSREEKRVGGIFRVIAAEKMIEDSSKVWDALVSPKQTVFPKSILAKNCHIYARSYPQYLMRVVEDERIENSNEIWIGEIGRKNFEICHQSDVLFSVLENFESSIPVLSDVVFEIRPRYKSLELKECDAKATIRELSRKLEHRVVTRDEIFLFKEYVLYVTELDVPWDEEEDEDALVVKDTVRGLVDSKETRIFVIKDEKAVTGKNFRLKNEARRVKTRKPRHMIELLTSDELIVPVKKKLMRPCITLTSSVLEGHGVHEIDTSVDCPRVKLDLDCCVLDRVLLCVVLGEMSLLNVLTSSLKLYHTDTWKRSGRKPILKWIWRKHMNYWMQQSCWVLLVLRTYVRNVSASSKLEFDRRVCPGKRFRDVTRMMKS